MEYDKIIIDMLNRICVLEEQVRQLREAKTEAENKITTADIREYILSLQRNAFESGKQSLELVANDIHKALKLKSRMKMVCNAMRQVMKDGDIILHQTPSGDSSTLKIRYFLENNKYNNL